MDPDSTGLSGDFQNSYGGLSRKHLDQLSASSSNSQSCSAHNLSQLMLSIDSHSGKSGSGYEPRNSYNSQSTPFYSLTPANHQQSPVHDPEG